MGQSEVSMASRSVDGKLTVYIDGPDGTVVAFVSTKTFAIVGKPSVDGWVLCDREEQITLAVEFDLSERTLVSRQQDGPLNKCGMTRWHGN